MGTSKASEAIGVKIPVIMVPFAVGEQIKQTMSGIEFDECTAQLHLSSEPGSLYAWGYGENGRLGLV